MHSVKGHSVTIVQIDAQSFIQNIFAMPKCIGLRTYFCLIRDVKNMKSCT